MLVVFRVDSSHQIGIGHLMRCLTLATALREQGATCEFICRSHAHNSIDLIKQEHFRVYELPQGIEPTAPDCLGVAPVIDATETLAIIKSFSGVPDWLIVDHYGIDRGWEQIVRPFVKRIFVIDDLANCPHECDVLLDQNYFEVGANPYEKLVPSQCNLLLGSSYVILNSQYHQYAEKRNTFSKSVKNILVSFGSSDLQNLTGKILESVTSAALPPVNLDVVVGLLNPHKESIRNIVKQQKNILLHENICCLANLVAKADLAIGAAGISTWERCYLGVPTLVISNIPNQVPHCLLLHQSGYIKYIHKPLDDISLLTEIKNLIFNEELRRSMYDLCIQLIDGKGTKRVIDVMMSNLL